MGYPSDIRFAVPSTAYDPIMERYQQLASTLPCRLPAPEHHETITPRAYAAPGSVNTTVFGWDNIKWYADEPEISGFVNVLTDYCEDHNLPFQMVRIGADDDDVECDSSTVSDVSLAAYIYVERKLAVSY